MTPNRVLTEFCIINLIDRAERPDHKYTIPTHDLPIVLELSTLEVRPARNGKSRDSRFVTSQAMSLRAGRSAPAPRTATQRHFSFVRGIGRFARHVWHLKCF